MSTPVKKKKQLMFKGKPLYRTGDTIYYGNLTDKMILVLEVLEKQKVYNVDVASKIKLKIIDNTGEFGKGNVYRQSEKENMFKALDVGAWWLQDALQMSEQ